MSSAPIPIAARLRTRKPAVAPVRRALRRRDRSASCSASNTAAVHAQADVTVGGGHRSRSRPRSRRPCPDSSASCAAAGSAHTPGPPRASPAAAGEHVRRGVRVQLLAQQVRDERLPAGRAVVGRELGSRANSAAASACAAARKPSSTVGLGPSVLEAEQRRGPDPAAHEQRRAALARRRKPTPSGPTRQPLPGRARRAGGRRGRRLEQEAAAAVAHTRERERARQVGPLVGPPPSPRRC